VLRWLERVRVLKASDRIALVLVGGFSIGAALFNYLQSHAGMAKAGLSQILFGQGAALSPADLAWIAAVAVLAAIFVFSQYHRLVLLSFDSSFAKVTLMSPAVDLLFLLLFSGMIVVTCQALGAVLSAAWIVIPAVTALLWSRRLSSIMALAFLFALVGGALGLGISGSHWSWPAGPSVIVVLSCLFTLSVLLHPNQGWLVRAVRAWWGEQAVRNENMLRRVYQFSERRQVDLLMGQIDVTTWAAFQNQTVGQARKDLTALFKAQLIDWVKRGEFFQLTPKGVTESLRMIRNHRLWELYSHQVNQVPLSEVHAVAELKEHMMSPEEQAEVDKLLRFPLQDPHGRKIPKGGSDEP
jgi:manganese/zinc/iron transport system permease protein